MKIQLIAVGFCVALLFSCNKSSKPEERVSQNSDSTIIAPPEKDTVPPEEIKEETKTYLLIVESKTVPGDILTTGIEKLSEPLKAIAALYSGLGGSGCDGENCGLTTALGLGKQGSQKQKDLVKKWFGKDAAAQQLMTQDFYQAPNSSSNFSDFQFLNFEQKGDTVTVNYSLMIYSHGETSYIKGPDRFVISGSTIETLHRNIWKDVK